MRGFGQIWKSKMADRDGCHLEMITQFLRYVTSFAHDADVTGDISRRSIYPPKPRCHSLYTLGVP